MRKVEIKVLNAASQVPEYGTIDSAGMDLVACISTKIEIPPLSTSLINTGIAISMQTVPEHLMAMIAPRSGKGHKEGKVLGNLVGIIDKDYEGEIMVSMWNRNPFKYVTVEPGERIAQLIFVPVFKVDFTTVNEFSTATSRGTAGFGSTGG